MGELGNLGDKFPEELKKAHRLGAAGIEPLGDKKYERRQKPRENGDKNNEAEDTASSTTLARGDNVMSENDNQVQSNNTRTPRNESRDAYGFPIIRPTEIAFDRGSRSLEKLADHGLRIDVHTDPTDYSAGATFAKGAALGAAVGATAGGLIVAFATQNPTTGAVLAGVGVGGLTGAVVVGGGALMIFDGKPKVIKPSAAK